jgi:hypothetical protein
MDRFFKTTTRFRDLYRQIHDQEPEHCTLMLSSRLSLFREALVDSLQDFSSHGFSFWDLVESTQTKIVWITQHAYVANELFRFGRQKCWKRDESVELYATRSLEQGFDGSTESLIVFASSFKELTSACTAVFSLLASSNVVKVYVHESSELLMLPVTARTLSNFVRESHSLEHIQFDEKIGRVSYKCFGSRSSWPLSLSRLLHVNSGCKGCFEKRCPPAWDQDRARLL